MPTSSTRHDVFPPTQWSVILHAQGDDSVVRSEALDQICRTYWHPIYAYVRSRGFSPEDAADLTQGFFASLLRTQEFDRISATRGKLRTFLLVAVRNFMNGEWRRRRTQKRGGDAIFLPIDLDEAERHTCLVPTNGLTPEVIYERHWASALLETVMARLEQAFAKDGKTAVFQALKPSLSAGRGEKTYQELGEALGMSVAAVKTTVFRIRQRYRDLLLEEIEGTLEPGESAEEELRHLFGVFQGEQAGHELKSHPIVEHRAAIGWPCDCPGISPWTSEDDILGYSIPFDLPAKPGCFYPPAH